MNFEDEDWNAAILEDLSPPIPRQEAAEGFHQRSDTHPNAQPRSKKHQRRQSGGGRRSRSGSQQLQLQRGQSQRQEEKRKWGSYKIARASTARERFLCIAKVKQKSASGPFKLKLSRAILSYLRREIRDLRDNPEGIPDHCVKIEEHGQAGGALVIILKMEILEELLPKFQRLKASKASNRYCSKQLESDVHVRFQDPGEYPLNTQRVKPPITLEVLNRLVPRKVDLDMRQFFKDQWTKSKHDFYTLIPLLELICSSGQVFRSNDPRSGERSQDDKRGSKGQKQKEGAPSDKIDLDIILRLNSGARCRFEKRFTGPKRQGLELRVAKGTKLEFFWFHLFEWFHDIRISTKYRRRIFTQLPEALFRLIIGYVVDEPNSEISTDVSSWFKRSLVICKMNANKKAGKGGWNNLAKNSGKHSYSRTILKTQPSNFGTALKKRFGLKNLDSKAVETLFLAFQDYEPKQTTLDE